MPDANPTPPPAPSVPPVPPVPPPPPSSVDWAAEAAKQSQEYATRVNDSVNKKLAEKFALKNRELAQKTGDAKANADATASSWFGSEGGVTVSEKDGRTIVKQGDKVIVDVPSKHRERSSQGDIPDNVVPIVFFGLLFTFLIIKTLMSPFTKRQRGYPTGGTAVPGATAAGPGLSAEESVALQKLQQTLGKMERRVEALETILADPRRTAAFTTTVSRSANPSASL